MRRRIGGISVILCLIIICFDISAGYGKDFFYDMAGSEISFTGKVVKEIEKDGYTVLYMDDVVSEKRKYDHRIKVTIYDDITGLMYCRLSVKGEVAIPTGRRNPGCFDYRKYLKSIDIYNVVSNASYQIIKKPEGPERICAKLRYHTKEFLKENLSEESFSVLMGIIFADSSYMEDGLLEVFRKGGTAHILAVSGMHLGILYAFLARLRKRKRSLFADLITSFFLFFYAFLAGFSASVVRAFIMIVLHMISEHMNLRYDFFCATCTSMIIILVCHPYQLFNSGFQMTFLACYTIAFIMPVISEKMDGIFKMPVVIQVGMIPYTAYTYNYFSPVAIISNVPVLYISAVLVPLSLIIIPLSYLPVIGITAGRIAGFFAGILCFFNRLTYMDGILTFDVPSMPLWILFSYYGVLICILSEWGIVLNLRKKKEKILKAVLLVMAASVMVSFGYRDNFGKDEFVFLDVGQGDCLHIAGRHDVLIDGGGSYNYNVGENILKPYLLKNNVRKIDYAFVTHLHDDHFKGICELSKEYRIDTLALFCGNKVNEGRIREMVNCRKIIYLKKGDMVRIDKDLYISVLAPGGNRLSESDNENDNSLVLKAVYKGVSVLMTGDIDKNGEEKLLETDCRADILKVSHHGSRYSSSDLFIDGVNPDTAVISVGKNNYGHPADEVIEKFLSRGDKVYRTDMNGAIGIDITGKGGFRVDKMIR